MTLFFNDIIKKKSLILHIKIYTHAHTHASRDTYLEKEKPPTKIIQKGQANFKMGIRFEKIFHKRRYPKDWKSYEKLLTFISYQKNTIKTIMVYHYIHIGVTKIFKIIPRISQYLQLVLTYTAVIVIMWHNLEHI